ncbi:hypothetical protein HPGCJGGD_2629 [Methylobacterium haplocladii]|nr:hypothetical protein HPGCJGGD_2629 [Methylobacterium haplocladii]
MRTTDRIIREWYQATARPMPADRPSYRPQVQAASPLLSERNASIRSSAREMFSAEFA